MRLIMYLAPPLFEKQDNWAGPIKDFRLVVDKGQTDRLVSFCGEGVKKISATAFEMRARDFTPTQDLNIIILSRK